MRRLFGVIASSIIKKVSDLFNRTTSGSLGTADTGQTWSATKGVWYANGSQAQSDGTASTYPLASIATGFVNTVVSATVSGGCGPAFWVTDANSWWASVSFLTSSTSSYNCNPYNCNPYSCNPYNCNPYNCNPYTCNCSTSYSCAAYGSGCFGQGVYLDGTDCRCESNGGIIGPASASTSCQTCYQTCYNTCYATCYDTCYNTCTSTTYGYYLRLLSSVGGTVSTATGDVSLSAGATAIKVTTLGDSITAQAYSDSALTTTLGSALTYTPASPAKGTGQGIVKAPSDYSQGSTVDNFSAGAN